MPIHKQVRIKDIAKAAGVSTGTVDRVIHGRGNVSPQKQQKVLQVMAKMGYRRNLLASTLAYNKQFRFAVLLPDYQQDPYWEQVYSGVLLAFESVQHFGIELQTYLFDAKQPVDLLAQGKKLLEDPPDGLLFSPIFTKEAQALFRLCQEHEIPVVIINTLLENEHSVSYIGQHSYDSGYLAARLLDFAIQPQQSLLILHLEESAYISQHIIDKEAGFRDYFRESNHASIRIDMQTFDGYDDPGRLRPFLEEIVSMQLHLGGIFFTNSRAYKALDCWNEPVFYDKIIIGFDLVQPNIDYLKAGKINFLLNQNPYQQGFQGIMSLFKFLVQKEFPATYQYLPLDIVVKENVHYYLEQPLAVNTLP